MKKHRISKRIFAMLLVICMVFTMMPANVNAASKGDIEAGSMGMSGIQADDRITWPIEIYDYSNDGMLFEYASATGAAGTRWTELDKEEDHVYMPDMTTDYYSDFTNDKMQNSYVVDTWFPTWGHNNSQKTDAVTALNYHTFDSTLWSVGGTDLIDFRDRDIDGVFDGYGATIGADGKYTFANAYGYKFDIDDTDGTIDGEDATIITTSSAYESCNPNWAVSVQLRPTGETNEYKVIKVVKNPGSVAAAGMTFDNGDIAMVVHSDGSAPGAYANWMDKIAAMALKEGSDIITISNDGTSATVSVPAGQSDPNQAGVVSKDELQYAVLVYRTSDLEIAGTLEAFLRDKNGNKYFGQYEAVASDGGTTTDWKYCVLDFNYFDVNGSGNYSKEESWSLVANDIVGAGIRLTAPNYSSDTSVTVDSDDYQFMVSHFAMFDTYGEADAYGQKALVYNKHHIQEIYPKAEYSADYTTSEIVNSHIANYWFGVHNITIADGTNVTAGTQYSCTQTTDTNGRLYYNFDMFASQEAELIDISAIGGAKRADAKYGVLVYRVDAEGTLKPYTRDFSSGTTYGTKFYGDGVAIETSDTWTYKVFDVSNAVSDYGTTQSGNVYSAGINFVSSATDYNFQISHFALVSSPEEAEAYAKAALNYNNYSGIPAAYYNPIYNNQGYGLLTGSQDTQLTDGTTLSTIYDKFNIRLGYNFVPLYSDTDYDGTYETPSAVEDTYASLTDGIYYLEYGKSSKDLQTVITDGSVPDYDGSAMSQIPFDGYTLYGTLTEGSLTAGLLEGALGNDGNPVYREKVVSYLANLLHTTLTIPEYKDGFFNYDFVRGETSYAYGDDLNGDGILNDERVDLATAIRRRLGIDFEKQIDYDTNKANVLVGDITSTQEKADEGKLKGTWADCKGDIETCHDAAYYLLHNLFVEGSYNEIPEDEYNYLTLYKATLDSGKPAYVFDAGLTTADGKLALVYDTENKIIDYAGAEKKNLYYTTATTTTTYFPFLPITADNNEEGMTKSPYFADLGVGYNGLAGETYYNRDFNYVIKSHGEFVYHEDDALFFDFEGDDDVYLFINGQLVLDIGGAHSITKENIDVNTYVQAAYETLKTDPGNERAKALALEEGQVCTFDFFYMERHGYGANCRIATNLRVTDPAIHVEKDAYQENIEINYGGVVDEEKAIEYSFAMTNTGNTKLYNISFDDPFIGVRINGTEGLYIDPEMAGHVQDATGGTLEAGELTAIVTGYKAVTDGTGNYIDDGNGNMVETEVGLGTHIATENAVTFNDVKDKDGNPVNPNEALKNFMKTLEDGEGGLESEGSDTAETGSGGGLWVNSTLVIKGIYYTMTDKDKEADCFNNTVYVTATTMEDKDDVSCETLQGQASHKVNLPGEPYYYQWAGHEIILTPERLVEDIKKNADIDEPFYGLVDGLTSGNVSKIEETTVNERPITTTTVTIDDSNNVTINYTDGGTYVFYLKVYYLDNTKSVLVPIVVNVTDVEDSYIVLDYGLSVNLTADSGIFKYDSLTIPGRETDVHIMAIADGDSSPAYNASYGGETGKHVVTFDVDDDNSIKEEDGSFNLTGEGHEYTLTYTPENFMEGVDSIYAAVAVHDHAEDGFTPAGLNQEINIGREVQMFKKVSVLPANVVYYEDDFPAIKYVDENGEELPDAIFNQVSGSKDLTQSPDQNQEYGKDDAYKTNDEKSGNSITQITIKESGQVAYFEFTGTGFELISRTNAFDSAKLVVEVKDANGDTVRDIPVITEFDNGGDGGTEAIYQVPVIRVDDLTYGTYKVYISGMASRDYTKVDGQYVNVGSDGKPAIIPTILYVDGLRIFNPMEAEETEQYYNESENGAIFEEIRELIVGAKAAIGTYQYDNGETTVSYGTITWTENRNNSTQDEALFIGNRVESVNDYMALGPNNEVYMDSDYEGVAALVFYVKPDGIGEHNLQIAARAIDKGLFEGKTSTGTYAELQYAVVNDGQIEWKSLADITSATEQYYTIDYTACPYIEGKGYQVAIKVVDGMVSYTSLKYNRIVIEAQSDAFDETTLTYNANGILTDAETGEPTDATRVPAFNVLEDTFASNARYTEVDAGVEQKILYQTRDNADLRLIAYVDDLEKYDSVSFTLTIDGKETKPLVCTTAYEELIAAGKPYSTEDIYGSDGYFVTYTINGYLEKYAGKDVTITVTYKWLDGEYQETKARTETITIE